MNTKLGTTALVLAAMLASGCGSMSERERGTAQGAGVGAVAGNLWSKHMQDKQEALARASAGTGIEVARTSDDRLRLNVPADFSFDVGSATIQPAMRPVLDEIARNLDRNVRVTIVGHTDSSGSEALNERLAVDRASAVRDYLSVRGVASSRVTVQGRGEREPVATNSTDAGRAANRRVEIFLADPAA